MSPKYDGTRMTKAIFGTADTPDPRPVTDEDVALLLKVTGAGYEYEIVPDEEMARLRALDRPVSPPSELTAEEEQAIRDLADWPGPNWSDPHSTVLIDYIRQLLAALDAARAVSEPSGLTYHDGFDAGYRAALQLLRAAAAALSSRSPAGGSDDR